MMQTKEFSYQTVAPQNKTLLKLLCRTATQVPLSSNENVTL